MYAYHFSPVRGLSELRAGTHYGSLLAALDRMRDLGSDGAIYVARLPGADCFVDELEDDGFGRAWSELEELAPFYGVDISECTLKEAYGRLWDAGCVGYRYTNNTEDVGSTSFCCFGPMKPYLEYEVNREVSLAVLQDIEFVGAQAAWRCDFGMDLLDKHALSLLYDVHQDEYDYA